MNNIKYEKIAFFLACLLCGLSVILSTYPPMVDVPQHAAQIVALKAMLFNEKWNFKDLFEIKSFTPYWLGYGLVMALSEVLGIVAAMKLVVAGSLIAFVFGAARFGSQMGMPAAWRWTFLILPFGFAFQWGFLNFIVAAPLGLIFLSLIAKWREKLDGKTIFKIVGFLHLLFFAHLLVMVFVCTIAVFLLAVPWRGMRSWLLRCLPVFSVIPITLAWIIIGFFTAQETQSPIVWVLGINRITEFLPNLVSAPMGDIGYAIGGFFMLLPWLYGARPRHSLLAWMPFLIYFLWMVFVPSTVGGSYFTYQRFGIFGLPLYYVGFKMKNCEIHTGRENLIRRGTIAIAALMILWQYIRVDIFNAEIKGYQSIIKVAKPGQRMLMLPFDSMSQSNNSTFPLMMHMAGWYQAEHKGLVDFNFARFWNMPLHFKNNISPGIYSDIPWYPDRFDWERNGGENFQYIVLRHPQDASLWIHEKTHGNMVLLLKDGFWQIYGKVKNDKFSIEQ